MQINKKKNHSSQKHHQATGLYPCMEGNRAQQEAFTLLLQPPFPQPIWPYCFLLPVSHLLAPLDNHSFFLGTAEKCFPPTVPRAVQFSLGDWCQIAHLDIGPFVRPVLRLSELRHFIEHPCTPTGKAGELPPAGGQTLA